MQKPRPNGNYILQFHAQCVHCWLCHIWTQLEKLYNCVYICTMKASFEFGAFHLQYNKLYCVVYSLRCSTRWIVVFFGDERFCVWSVHLYELLQSIFSPALNFITNNSSFFAQSWSFRQWRQWVCANMQTIQFNTFLCANSLHNKLLVCVSVYFANSWYQYLCILMLITDNYW